MPSEGDISVKVLRLPVLSVVFLSALVWSSLLLGCQNPASPTSVGKSAAPTITISPSSLSMYPQDTQTLKATVVPSGLTVTWTSGDSSIATVDGNGKVTAVAKGSTTIHASVTDSNGQKATADVTTTVGGLANISGTVVGSVGGSAVAGATITAAIGSTVEGTTTTDGSGNFSFTGVHPGSYTVTATVSGRAGSQVQDLQVLGDATTTVHIVEELPVYASGNLTPPNATLTGVSPGVDLFYGGSITISATPASGAAVVGTSMHPAIQLSVSAGNSALVTAATSNTDSLTYSWTPQTTGDYNVVAVVYDNNNNRTEIDVPVSIPSGTTSTIIAAPSPYSITAETFGTSLQLFDIGTPSGVPTLNTANKSAVRLDSAQANSTVIVAFQVAAGYVGASGVHVYRATSANGTYALIGGSDTLDSTGTKFEYIDSSDGLTPGNTYYYKLAYYDPFGEGPMTAPLAVAILKKYSLSLVAPSDNGIVTGGSPTLSWTASGTPAGATRYDTVLVRRTDNGLAVQNATLTDSTSYTIPISLDTGQTYSWNIASVAVEQGATGIVSESFPTAPVNDPDLGQVAFSSNGSYFFVIQ